jgi:outer membrane immunogenic protein
MNRLSTALIAAATAIALTQMASAADLPRKAPAYAPPPPPALHNWTGFYIGGHLGAARSKLKTGALVSEAGEPDEITTDNNNGYIAGGQLGFNWQFGQWLVLGLEGDLGYLGLENRAPFPVGGTPEDEFRTKFGLYGTATGRLGLSFDRLLVYGKGGFVFAKVDHSATDFEDPEESVSFDKTRTGWTAGGGLEYAFTPNWSAKIEYLYMDFGDLTRPNPGDASESILFDNRVQTVKLGINYKFDWGRAGLNPQPLPPRWR